MSRTSVATQRLNRASRKANLAFAVWEGSGEKAEGVLWNRWQEAQRALKDAEVEYHEARAAQARKERGY